MLNHDHFDGSEENMAQKTIDTMVQSQHDCLVLRVCQQNMSKHDRNYSSYQIDIRSEAPNIDFNRWRKKFQIETMTLNVRKDIFS